MVDRIAIFDFDGTLFRSPEKPDWWPHQGFWGRLETLSPPFVPEACGLEWYVPSVVKAAHQAVSDPHTHTCLLTGRIPKFERRVRQLLADAGIRFDAYYFASGGNTLSFKVATIEELIGMFPEASTVEMWEDRQEHIGAFKQTIEAQGRTPIVHWVKSTPMEFAHSVTTERVVTTYLKRKG